MKNQYSVLWLVSISATEQSLNLFRSEGQRIYQYNLEEHPQCQATLHSNLIGLLEQEMCTCPYTSLLACYLFKGHRSITHKHFRHLFIESTNFLVLSLSIWYWNAVSLLSSYVTKMVFPFHIVFILLSGCILKIQ